MSVESHVFLPLEVRFVCVQVIFVKVEANTRRQNEETINKKELSKSNGFWKQKVFLKYKQMFTY